MKECRCGNCNQIFTLSNEEFYESQNPSLHYPLECPFCKKPLIFIRKSQNLYIFKLRKFHFVWEEYKNFDDFRNSITYFNYMQSQKQLEEDEYERKLGNKF